MTERLYRVVAPHFVAGLVVGADVVCVGAAPILRWAVGKPLGSLAVYFRRKGWALERLS